MEAHVQSVAGFVPGAKSPETAPHYVARRYAELVSSLRLLKTPVVEPMMGNILRVLRTEVEKLLCERLARQHATLKQQAAFLINNYELIASVLTERSARGEESSHFDQLLDSIKTVFVEEQLHAGQGAMIEFVKATEPLLMPGAPAADAAKVDRAAMEALTKIFYDTWRASIEAINREVVQSFANFKLGMEIIKQVRGLDGQRGVGVGSRGNGDGLEVRVGEWALAGEWVDGSNEREGGKPGASPTCKAIATPDSGADAALALLHALRRPRQASLPTGPGLCSVHPLDTHSHERDQTLLTKLLVPSVCGGRIEGSCKYV